MPKEMNVGGCTYITLTKVCEYLKLSPGMVMKMVRSNRLKLYSIPSNRWRWFKQDEVMEFKKHMRPMPDHVVKQCGHICAICSEQSGF